MYWSNYFIPTLKEIPIGTEAISHQLMLRAGLVHMLTSGVYSYLPLGLRVLQQIEMVIREEMTKAKATELLMPCLQPIELWQKTGRDQVLKEVMFKFEDNRKRTLCLGPTHEEVITEIVKNFVQSYRQLPIVLYQIQTKFRDEIRTRFGVVRACEFIMKDAYSFDSDQRGLEKNYQLMYLAYQNIFKRCGLETIILEADSGAMGGDVSHEFMVSASIGEDKILLCSSCGFKGAFEGKEDQKDKCPQCGNPGMREEVAMELGHIFQLGTKYSEAQQAQFLDEDGKLRPMIMGCYGIGVSRLIAAIVEKNHDEKGIIWPEEVAPFKIEILPIISSDNDSQIMDLARNYYTRFQQEEIEVILDDREESPGRKFNDADLIGIPYRVTIGARNLKDNKVEIKIRKTQDVILIDKNDLVNKMFDLLKDKVCLKS